MKTIIFLLVSTLCIACTSVNEDSTTQELNTKIDQWHKDAASANYTGYFDFISEKGVFIGTDISERWTKTEFSEFSKPYFDNGKAWSFVPKERVIRYNQEGTVAWFDEELSTWMGECRSTGVLSQEKKEWKLEHYQLSVTIDNDLMPQFLELIKEE